MSNEKGDCANSPQSNKAAPSTVAAHIVATVRLTGQGGRVRWSGRLRSATQPPTTGRGRVKGWSLASRRRFRDTLLTVCAPAGWSAYSVTLTVPAHPVGHPEPCIGVMDARRLWAAFGNALNMRGHAAIWRLEIQPRSNTERADIRGIPQPHWHIIGACPGAGEEEASWIRETWRRLLCERAAVAGAGEHAAVVDLCASWSDGQRRYLYDHASKRKAEQVASGWGRHWGVIGRRRFVEDKGRVEGVGKREAAVLARLLRRWQRRRVSDKRGRGGVNWSAMSIEDGSGGCRISWMGGSLWVPGGSSNRLWHDAAFRRSVEGRVTRCQGAQKRNVWALRGSRFRRSFVGQWFGAAGVESCLRAARLLCSPPPPAIHATLDESEPDW